MSPDRRASASSRWNSAVRSAGRVCQVTTAFTATETQLTGVYGRLAAAAAGPDGLIWLGTVNKDGGVPVPSDDRVVVLPPVASGGQSRA